VGSRGPDEKAPGRLNEWNWYLWPVDQDASFDSTGPSDATHGSAKKPEPPFWAAARVQGAAVTPPAGLGFIGLFIHYSCNPFCIYPLFRLTELIFSSFRNKTAT